MVWCCIETSVCILMLWCRMETGECKHEKGVTDTSNLLINRIFNIIDNYQQVICFEILKSRKYTALVLPSLVKCQKCKLTKTNNNNIIIHSYLNYLNPIKDFPYGGTYPLGGYEVTMQMLSGNFVRWKNSWDPCWGTNSSGPRPWIFIHAFGPN